MLSGIKMSIESYRYTCFLNAAYENEYCAKLDCLNLLSMRMSIVVTNLGFLDVA